jgi:hypothetical protein
MSPSQLSPVGEASAAERCTGDISTPTWNKTIERFALTPDQYYFDFFEDEFDNGRGNSQGGDNIQTDSEPYYGPEEDWMLIQPQNDLHLLDYDLQTTMLIGSDAVGVLRVNLDHEQRTTICVTISTPLEDGGYEEHNADVYLLTSSQFDRYSDSYGVNHGNWGPRGEGGEVSEISPEWRSFDISGWRSYRDNHQYEDINDVSFSIILDGPEKYEGLFGNNEKEYFHIVVDNTNNSHRNDAVPDNMTIVADVTVITEERSTILPPWTVSLVCMALMLGTLAIPLVMNKRYMKSGLDLVAPKQQMESGLVPTLEQKPES